MTTIKVRREWLYRGRVQGVGFRFTTNDVARRFPVTGHVENLPDGRVRVVAEGTTGVLDEFAESLQSEMRRNIVGVDVYDSEASGEFTEFEIRREY